MDINLSYAKNFFSNNSYYIYKKGITDELIKFLQIQTDVFKESMCLASNKKPTDFRDDCIEESFTYYAAHFSEALMVFLKDKIEKIVGKELCPTYSYMRIYYEGAELKKHVDRSSCEYSITICIKNDITPWDIWFDINGESKSIKLNEGDFVIYKGMELPHWRNKYEGKCQIQFFLHYVDKHGKYKEWNLDKRVSLCLQK
jgi:hypothetical protein